jgi:hypothetical protein
MQLEAHPSAFPNAKFEQLMARYQQAKSSRITGSTSVCVGTWTVLGNRDAMPMTARKCDATHWPLWKSSTVVGVECTSTSSCTRL